MVPERIAEFSRKVSRLRSNRAILPVLCRDPLMRNAVEAMEQGPRRELSVCVGAAEGMVQVSVVDTGPGVPPEVASKLFQPFVTTKADGMGIGLSLCLTIIEAHGGRLWMEPNPDGGSLFHFTVPIAPG